jgi:phage major head subunit gpT-like protein
MTELTEASLTKALEEIRQMLADEPITLTIKPLKLIIRPADLAELGLTVDDVKKMIRDRT